MTYLVGENMTGGYGGADILKSCTIGVDKGEITREEAGRLYRAKFPNDPGIKRREEDKKKDGKQTP